MARARFFSFTALSGMLVLAALPLACAASATDTESRLLDSMSKEIDQAQGSEVEGLAEGAVADSGAPRESDAKKAERAPAAPLALVPMPTPRLRVVRVAPDESADSEAQKRHDEDLPRLVLTNADLGPSPTQHAPARARAAKNAAKPSHDTTDTAGAALGAPPPPPPVPPPPPQAVPPRPAAAPAPPGDEDDEHLAPAEEDNEHLAPDDEDNEHLVGGKER